MRVAEMTWEEYRDTVRSHVLVLPVGSIEQHGPHLPLAADTIISSALAERLAERVPAMILPAIAYGHWAHLIQGGGSFPGRTSLQSSTLIALILDVLRETYAHGARRFLILDSHIANLPFAHDAAEQFVTKAPGARIMVASWWDFAPESSRNAIAEATGVPRSVDHHAAMVETSLVMHLAPGFVRCERLVDEPLPRRVRYLVLPVPADLVTQSGVVYQATCASAEIGERLTREIVDAMVAAVELELASAR